MKPNKQSQPEQELLPYPEITCPCCSGSMEFESYRPAEIVPSCYTLKCCQCGGKEELFFDNNENKEN